MVKRTKHFGHSNSWCTRASRAITCHAPIGEYHLQFFPREDFSCPCGNYPIETRRHILHECRRFNNYWNPRRDTISHFVAFLESNPNAFSFGESLAQQYFCLISSYFIISPISFSILFSFFLNSLLSLSYVM